MLMGKKQSIASFIEKLPMDGSVGDCESTLLATNMYFMGSGTNGDGCSNSSPSGCETNTSNCTNVVDACKHASNTKGCMNTEPVVPPKNVGDCYCAMGV